MSTLRVLIVRKSSGYRHDSTVTVMETLKELGVHFNWLVAIANEDLREFDSMEQLRLFDVIFFAHTSGDIFTDKQLDNLAEFGATEGKGCVGFHSSADTHREDQRFQNIFGAAYKSHDGPCKGTVKFDLRACAKLGMPNGALPETLEVEDEFFVFDKNFCEDKSSGFRAFLFADETSYPCERKGVMGDKHPLGWYREVNRTRAFFCALGHTAETFKLEAVRQLMIASVNWAGFKRELHVEKKFLGEAAQVEVIPSARKLMHFRDELAVVSHSSRHFEVIIQHGAFKDMQTMAGVVPPNDFQSMHFVIADATVDAIYGDAVENILRLLGVRKLTRLSVPEGEESKSSENFLALCEKVLSGDVDKHSTIITLGGGMVNNLGGMVAAIVYRGLRLVHLATSFLGQVDAATGIKQAINWKTGKNQLGAIYAPSYVVLDTDVLKTLPLRERINGLSEAIKHALCQDGEFLQYLLEHNVEDLNDPQFLHHCVKVGSAKKALCLNSTKAKDYAEMCMQYGHAYGHAIEHLSGYDLRHGEAIAIGMTLCCDVAILLGHGDPLRLEQLVSLHQDVFERYHLPWKIPDHITNEQICDTLKHDKHYLHSLPTMMTLRDVGAPFASKSGRTGFRIPYNVIEEAMVKNRNRTFVRKNGIQSK